MNKFSDEFLLAIYSAVGSSMAVQSFILDALASSAGDNSKQQELIQRVKEMLAMSEKGLQDALILEQTRLAASNDQG